MVSLCSLLAGVNATGHQLLHNVFCIEIGHRPGKAGTQVLKSTEHGRGEVCGFWQPDSSLCSTWTLQAVAVGRVADLQPIVRKAAADDAADIACHAVTPRLTMPGGPDAADELVYTRLSCLQHPRQDV